MDAPRSLILPVPFTFTVDDQQLIAQFHGYGGHATPDQCLAFAKMNLRTMLTVMRQQQGDQDRPMLPFVATPGAQS